MYKRIIIFFSGILEGKAQFGRLRRNWKVNDNDKETDLRYIDWGRGGSGLHSTGFSYKLL
jgi:hypothetical protein